MKIAAISDLHGYFPKIPDEAEIVLIAGDICPFVIPRLQYVWLEGNFKPWLKSLDRPVFACAGNHDWPFYSKSHADLREKIDKMDLPWTYLEDSGAEYKGLKIWGTPWQLEFYDWAFNLKEYELANKWFLIPEDTDILISHSPPFGFGDQTARGEMVGSPSLTDKIREVSPKLCVFGHIHPGRGQWDYYDSKLANVTVVNEAYKMVYEPMIFDVN